MSSFLTGTGINRGNKVFKTVERGPLRNTKHQMTYISLRAIFCNILVSICVFVAKYLFCFCFLYCKKLFLHIFKLSTVFSRL